MRDNDKNLTFTLTEWINTCGIDLFGCDDNCAAGRDVIGAALRLHTVPEEEEPPPCPPDYASLHDEFLESLLFEQTSRGVLDNDNDADSTTVVSEFCENSERDEEAFESPRKRRRPVRLHRRASPVRRRTPRQPLHDSSNALTVSLGDLSKSSFPHPSHYLHEECRLQKDKGKGKSVGAEVCAEGMDACLEKLRAKMRILTDNVLDKNKGPATMKRRKARIADETADYTETRSLIELRMGFLSMTYGVLLRWNHAKKTKINMVVLRKMCHEAFYPSPALSREPEQPQYVAALPPQKLSHARDVIENKHAVLQREDGMEITLLEPPFRVPRPSDFEPALLTVSVLFATGLSRDSNWTVKMTYAGHTENILLAWDSSQRCFIPKLGEPLKYTINSTNLNLSDLDLKLFEHRIKKRGNRRHIESMGIPLHNLEPQPYENARTIRLMIPCKHDGEASIALGLLLCSDYAHWLNKELEARRREEVVGYVYGRPFRRISHLETAAEYEEERVGESRWDWICSVC